MLRFIPGSSLAHVEFGFEHEGAGGAYADAIAAINAGRFGKRNVELGSDVSGEAASGHADGESILSIDAASLDALVAENAFGVIADVKIVVELWRLGGARGSSAKPPGIGAIALKILLQGRSRGDVDGRGQELENEAAAEANALGIGFDAHAGFDFARARGDQDSRTFEFNDADAADIDGSKVFKEAKGWRADAEKAGGVKNGCVFGDRHGFSVNLELDEPGRGGWRSLRNRSLGNRNERRGGVQGFVHEKRLHRLTAESKALEAVWPKPQMEASRMA